MIYINFFIYNHKIFYYTQIILKINKIKNKIISLQFEIIVIL